ncbi:alpha/beta hydrolase [Arthrobacter sp. RIT-PI-e]|uniref:alpha/beta hydrolase n=1 Tax=Arthrobacter sp. RIT-PI-e TaxID=1681197 RepID=UPI00067612BB|nr:alpha/beta hydrolase-fold protein [Arthrobacter sp. RIT-PI-e]
MNPVDWQLITPAALTVFAIAGGLSLLWLIAGHRRFLVRTVLPAAVLGTVCAVGIWLVTEKVLNVWGAPQPPWFYVLGAAAITAVLLAGRKVISQPHRWQRALSVVAALVVLAAAAGGINAYFGYYPTLRAAAGGSDIAELGVVTAPDDPGPVTTLGDWTPPADMPASGEVRETTIPGTVSGVDAGTAYVSLPPAYLSATPANLPVLVLIHGDPGGPKDWITGGELPAVMDAYAAAHKGLAPIVVLPDASASTGPPPSPGLDSNYGKAGTYLSTDVPDWVRSTLGAGTHAPTDWAIGGFSPGGTCSLTLAMNHPDVYPSFLDISGENAPTIAAGQDTLSPTTSRATPPPSRRRAPWT